MRRYCAEMPSAKMANSVSVFPGSESRTHGLLRASPVGFREKRRRDMSDTVIINEVRRGCTSIPWRSCASPAPFPSARASPVPLCLTLQVDEHAEKLQERACHDDSQGTEAPFAL